MNNLEEMKLTAMKDNLDHMIEQNAKGEVNFTEGLYQLTQYQIEEKREKESQWCIQWGAFPHHKYLEDLTFHFSLPSTKKKSMVLGIYDI